ncbi:MFS transporter [Anaerosinus massiliensis]|uniref:MFS transporter n=1 Tax=Massilibacillus massiliensis TaxID=1806837 RepID=UPI000DA62A49|nr:MFS transporter [Massilibacillus massiliensis]
MQTILKEPLWTKNYNITILAMLFIFIPYSLYLPILPLYIAEDLHGSMQMAGLSNAVFLLASVLFRTQTARLENVFSTKTTIKVSCFLFLIANSLLLFTTNLYAILGIRFLGGICFAIINTAIMALGCQFAPNSRKGEGISYLTTVITAGSAIGPFIGLYLAHTINYNAVFIFCVLLTFLGFILLPFIDMNSQTIAKKSSLYSFTLQDILEMPVIPICLITLLTSIAYAGVLSFVAVYANQLQIINASNYYFVVLALFSLLIRLVSGKIFDRFGANIVLYPCFIFLAAGLLMLAYANGMFSMMLSAAFIGIGYGVLVPTIQTLALHCSSPKRVSIVTATYFTCLDLGLATGAYLLGALAPLLGYRMMYLILAPFTLCILVLYYVIYGRNAKHVRKTNLYPTPQPIESDQLNDETQKSCKI